MEEEGCVCGRGVSGVRQMPFTPEQEAVFEQSYKKASILIEDQKYDEPKLVSLVDLMLKLMLDECSVISLRSIFTWW